MIVEKTTIQDRVIPSKRWIYLVSGIAIMMCLGTVYTWSVFRIPIENIFSIGSIQSGLPYMVSLVFYALFMLFTGKYLDKFTPRLIIILGGFLVSLGWILSSFATNIYFLTIAYGVIMGTGVGIVYGVPLSIAVKWFPAKKGLVVGIVLIGFGLSPLITAPVVNYIVGIYGVMKAFLIMGVSFAVLIPLLSYPMTYPSSSNRSDENKIISNNLNDLNTKAMIKSKSFKGLYLSFMFGTMIGLMLVGITSNIGVDLIYLSPDRVALSMSLFAIFGGIGRPIFGWLTDKLSLKKSMLISYVLIIFGALLMLVASKGNVAIYIIAFSIFWFNLGGWLAIAPTSTLALYGNKHYSQNYGVMFTAYGIGAIIGVFASGVLTDIYQNYYFVFYLVIAVCILGIISSQGLIRMNLGISLEK